MAKYPILIIWPNTLYEDNKLLDKVNKIYIVEHPLFFTKYNYHKMKLVLHRASMKYYENWLKSKFGTNKVIKYIEFSKYKTIKEPNISYNPNDHIIWKEYENYHESPGFLMSEKHMKEYYNKHKNKNQRHVHFYNYHKDIISEDYPRLSKYLTRNYDEENRNKFPDTYGEPPIFSESDEFIDEAIRYVNKHFPNNPGNPNLIYPTISFEYTKKLFRDFVKSKLVHFGDYQDAVRSDVQFGYHSVLSPLMNIGLITPQWVLRKLESELRKIKSTKTKLTKNNIEGYLRQLIGWREYCRYMYVYFRNKLKSTLGPGAFRKKVGTRKLNRKIWYDFSVEPNIDFLKVMLDKVNNLAYLHHIERLMYIGNFMLLSHVSPKEVFEWFQCMFLDSYHIFMYPNVYGMSQHTSGIMMSKMYLCSSNYITHMSDYKRNPYIDNLYRNFKKLSRV